MTRSSLSDAYFEAIYDRDPDPWRFRTSAYEDAKYAATLAALPCPRFADAFEVGCSVGVLTRQLADRCDRLLAVDVAESALAQARAACAGTPWVRFARMRVPEQWPDETFDLIVLSEVLYYLAESDVRCVATAARSSLRRGGTVVLVHWTGETDYPLTADAAAGAFVTASELRSVTGWRTEQYRLDMLQA